MARSTGESLPNARSRCGAISCSSSAARLATPRTSSSRNAVFSYASLERASSSGSAPESCQAYSACSATSRAWRLACLMQLHFQSCHFHRDPHGFGALVEPRVRLLFVVGGEDTVRHRQAELERHVHHAARRLVR